jgi:predicted nucleic-acid-binding protein
MIAVDTNVLLRLLLRDDEAQFRVATRLFGDGREYTAAPTVILELVLVLEGTDRSRAEIVASLKALLGLPNFSSRHAVALHLAVGWYELGLHFADALHLALSHAEEGFITFDGRFAKRANRLAAGPRVTLADG